MVTTLFFVFISILVIGICAAVANVSAFSLDGNFRRKFVIHAICAGVCAIGALGAGITGTIWIVGKLSHG